VLSVPAGGARVDFALTRTPGRVSVSIDRRAVAGAASQALARLILAPGFPLDATVRTVTVNGRDARFEIRRMGDIQQAVVVIAEPGAKTSVVFNLEDGTDVYQDARQAAPGDRNEGLRVLRSHAGSDRLVLTLEGRAGRTYSLRLRTPRKAGAVSGGELKAARAGDPELVVTFEGSSNDYVRKQVTVALGTRLPR